MDTPRSRILPSVAVAVAALVLGSVGTAEAGGLTRHAVKKIAAQVVKKNAHSLSVAHADSATTLGGLTAGSLQNDVTVYTATVATPSHQVDVRLPLAPGSYEIGYSVFAGTAPHRSDCWIYVGVTPTTGTYAGEQIADSTVYDPAVSGFAAVTVPAGDVVGLSCQTDVDFTTDPTEPIQVVVTKIDNLTTATLTPSRSQSARGVRR